MPTNRFSTMSIRPTPLRPASSFAFSTEVRGPEFLAVDGDRHAVLEADGDLFQLVRGLLRGDAHGEIDHVDAGDRQVFEIAGLVGDVQAVLVAAVRLGGGRLDRDTLLLAVGDQFGAAGEPVAELALIRHGAIICTSGPTPRRRVGTGTGRSPCRSPRGRTRWRRLPGRPATSPWRSAAGRCWCPAGRSPSYFAPAFSTGKAKSRHISSVTSTMRATSAPQSFAFWRIACLSSPGWPQSTYTQCDVPPLVLQPAEDDGGVQTAGVGEHAGGHGGRIEVERDGAGSRAV